MRETGLKFGPLGPGTLHLCVDMQRIFAEKTDWHVEWTSRVLPVIEELVAHSPENTLFTRFIPLEQPAQGIGTWKRYYQRWSNMTLRNVGLPMVDLVPELARYVPPARIFDKRSYSPWNDMHLQNMLRNRHIDTLVITGGETDMCVLATVIGAVDRGYRVIVVKDALCSVDDKTHESILNLFSTRYSEQIETVTCETVLQNWPAVTEIDSPVLAALALGNFTGLPH